MRACECEELCKCEMFADTGRCCDCVWATKNGFIQRGGKMHMNVESCSFFFFFSPRQCSPNVFGWAAWSWRKRGVIVLASWQRPWRSPRRCLSWQEWEKTAQWRSSLSSRFVSFSSATSRKRPRLSFCRSPHKGCRCLPRIVTHCLVLKNGI